MVGVRGSIPLAPTISYNLLSLGNTAVSRAGAAPIAQSPFGNRKQNGASTKTCDPCETRAPGCLSVPVAAHSRRAVGSPHCAPAAARPRRGAANLKKEVLNASLFWPGRYRRDSIASMNIFAAAMSAGRSSFLTRSAISAVAFGRCGSV